MSWGLYGIIVTQMGDLDQNIALTDGGTQSIRDYLYDNYHYEYSFRWPVRTASFTFSLQNSSCRACCVSGTCFHHAQHSSRIWAIPVPDQPAHNSKPVTALKSGSSDAGS